MDFRSNIDFGSFGAKVTGLPSPTVTSDAATKGYVDSAVEGLAWKDSVRVRTTTNVNTASPGASLDAITMAAGDRVLLSAQTTGSQNGIWVWNGAAVPMTRAPDANTAAELEQATTLVEEGTSAGTSWRQTAVNLVLDTDPIAWTQFGSGAGAASTSSAGTVQLATQTEVDAGTDALKPVTPATLANWANRPKRFAGNIGDGSATQIDVTHNFGTRDLTVQVFRNGTPWDLVHCDVAMPDTNTVRLNFAAAPTASQYRVVIKS
jgi:hypothetical protein